MSAAGVWQRVRRWPARLVILFIEAYRTYVSPLRLPTCRFVPTCSEYAVTALTRYGLVRGGWLSIVRLAKCAPWHAGGWDPVPGDEACNSSACGHQSTVTTTEKRST